MLLLFEELPAVVIAAYCHCCGISKQPAPARVSPGAACRVGRVFWRGSMYFAPGTFRSYNAILFVFVVILGFILPMMTGALYAVQRTSYGLYNRASCRMPGYTIRLPGASPAWTPTREGRCPSSGLSPKTERGGVA